MCAGADAFHPLWARRRFNLSSNRRRLNLPAIRLRLNLPAIRRRLNLSAIRLRPEKQRLVAEEKPRLAQELSPSAMQPGVTSNSMHFLKQFLALHMDDDADFLSDPVQVLAYFRKLFIMC